MTAAAATIPAGLTAWTTDATTLKYTIETPAYSATNSNFASQTSSWVSKVTVALVGQADAQKEPAKTMNSWYTTHTTAISGQSLASELKVSSWAVVVDVATKVGNTYSQAIEQNAAGACLNSAAQLAGGATVTAGAPKVGDAGDTWSIALTIGGTATVKQPSLIRSGVFVSSQPTTTASQISSIDEQSWSYSWSTAIASFSDVTKNTSSSIVFGTKDVCDTKKWASATACLGFNGVWGKNTNTFSTATVVGSHRYFLWLADAATDKTKIVSIEDKDVLNLVIIENHANVYSTTVGANTNNCSTAAKDGKTEYAVFTGTYTKGSGATSTILGASALVAGLIASLF